MWRVWKVNNYKRRFMDLAVIYCIVLAVISFVCLLIYQAYYCSNAGSIAVAVRPAMKMNVKKIAAGIFYIVLAISFYIYMEANGSIFPKTLKYLSMLFILAAIAWIDWKTRKIPNTLLLLLICTRLLFFVYESIKEPDYTRFNLVQMGFGALLCLVILLICRLLVRNSIGMGDIKLFAILGIYFGYDVMHVMFFSFLCTAIYSIYLLASKKMKKKDSVPMGPFIFLGTVLSIVCI